MCSWTLAERQPSHDDHAHANDAFFEDDSPALSVHNGSEAMQLQHLSDCLDISGGFQIVQVTPNRRCIFDPD